MKLVEHPFDEAVVAKTHPSMYLMHKYWARKPHNVVSRYIEYYTNEGDTVLDPFMGSGVTVCESLRLKRKAIGIDLNPIACFIAQMTAQPINLMELHDAYQRLEDSIEERINSYYLVKCSYCKEEAVTTHVVWKQQKYTDEKMFLLKVFCPHCQRKEQRKPTDNDILRYEKIAKDSIPYFYPKNVPLHSTAKRSVEYIHELFTHRALICLSILLNSIQNEKEGSIKELLQFCFTSAVSQASKLVFIITQREGKNTHRYEVGSWTVPNYWVPEEHFEINVWNCFEERYKKIRRGKTETLPFYSDKGKSNTVKIYCESATKLKNINSNSVDYIFTDPPYGSAVPYFGLSLMWASWLSLDKELKFDDEIIVSERADQDLEIEEYRKLLKEAFQEMYRVLKDNGHVTVTFHNREIKVWNALVSAALEAGLIYENDNYVLPPRVSAKSLLSKSGSMTGDIYINFRKPDRIKRIQKANIEEVEQLITKEAEMIIRARNGQATTDQLARGIYAILIKNNLFSKLQDKDIRIVLESSGFEETIKNNWILPKSKEIYPQEFIPLTKRIQFIIDNVLESKPNKGFELDDFLVPIFTQLKNGLTPENKEIIEVLRERAESKKDKWYQKGSLQAELFAEYAKETKPILPEDELREHEQFIYQLAKVGFSLDYQIWVGKNEQNKEDLLQKLSVQRLEIPGLSEKFISDNRINQIDLIWINPDKGRYIAFEVENSTGVVPGIQRLANLTEALTNIKIPIYLIIPDKFKNMAERIFESESGKRLSNELRKYILYSELLHNIDLLDKKIIKPAELFDSIAHKA